MGLIQSVIVSLLFSTVTYAKEVKVPNPDIAKFFNEFSYEKLDLADTFYDENIEFHDPLGEARGLKAMKAYYAKLYKNVISIRFDFKSVVTQGDEQVGVWVMHLRAKGLNNGKEISVPGNSHIIYKNGKAIYHRDYFDMGAFVYEHIPVLSQVVQFIKNKLGH